MTSLCRQLSAQEIVNWVTAADRCVHTADATKLSPTSCEFVFTPPMRQNSFVVSASAVCIGHYSVCFTEMTCKSLMCTVYVPGCGGSDDVISQISAWLISSQVE